MSLLVYKAMRYTAGSKQQLPDSDLKSKGKPVKSSEDIPYMLTVSFLVENAIFLKGLCSPGLICVGDNIIGFLHVQSSYKSVQCMSI